MMENKNNKSSYKYNDSNTKLFMIYMSKPSVKEAITRKRYYHTVNFENVNRIKKKTHTQHEIYVSRERP